MTDELDVLRHERDVVEPDPEFRAQLMDRLRQRMADPAPMAGHGRVIDLDGPPLTDVRPLPNDAGAHRRRSLWMAVAAVLALFVAGIALVQGGEDAPDIQTEPEDDQALAELATLTPDDVGSDWAPASPEEEAQHRADEEALADCLGPDVSALRKGRATARALFVGEDNGNPEHLASTAFVYRSAADAHAVLDRVGLPATQRCLVDTIEQQVLDGARDGLTLITGRPLALDDLEVRTSSIDEFGLTYLCCDDRLPFHESLPDDHHAFTVKVTLAADGREVDVYRTLVFINKARVGMQFSTQAYYDSITLGVVEIFDRVPPAEPEDTQRPATRRLPVAGEQPVDRAAAEEEVRLAYTGIFDATTPREARSQLSERPAVWIAANLKLEEGEYAEFVEGMFAVVEEVVFTDPTHAAVRFRLDGPNGSIPQSVEIGGAVRVDGRWLVAIETTCDLVLTAEVRCDMSP